MGIIVFYVYISYDLFAIFFHFFHLHIFFLFFIIMFAKTALIVGLMICALINTEAKRKTVPRGTKDCCDARTQCKHYGGDISVTASGKTCQRWDSDEHHKRSNTVKHTFELGTYGLGKHNHCRNPSGHSNAWCYTIDAEKRWEDCEIPDCEKVAIKEKKDYVLRKIKYRLSVLPRYMAKLKRWYPEYKGSWEELEAEIKDGINSLKDARPIPTTMRQMGKLLFPLWDRIDRKLEGKSGKQLLQNDLI